MDERIELIQGTPVEQPTTQTGITHANRGPAIPFKVFGLQRSGTNLMVALLTRNFHVHSLEHEAEWKHGPVRMPNRTWNGVPARFILCVKNPYAWVVSCYRYFQRSWQCDPTVAPQFQQNPSMPFDQFLRSPSYGFESPIHRWNQMHRLWLATLPTARTQVVRQEDQLTQSREVLYRIE